MAAYAMGQPFVRSEMKWKPMINHKLYVTQESFSPTFQKKITEINNQLIAWRRVHFELTGDC
jgi:hypothetical protein